MITKRELESKGYEITERISNVTLEYGIKLGDSDASYQRNQKETKYHNIESVYVLKQYGQEILTSKDLHTIINYLKEENRKETDSYRTDVLKLIQKIEDTVVFVDLDNGTAYILSVILNDIVCLESVFTEEFYLDIKIKLEKILSKLKNNENIKIFPDELIKGLEDDILEEFYFKY